jgi:hypothetical protein
MSVLISGGACPAPMLPGGISLSLRLTSDEQEIKIVKKSIAGIVFRIKSLFF